ncbi:hypothetical protein Hanom_Chr14g01286711 [Helianthus anomalus]
MNVNINRHKSFIESSRPSRLAELTESTRTASATIKSDRTGPDLS